MRDVRHIETSHTQLGGLSKTKMQILAPQLQQPFSLLETGRLFPCEFPQVIKYMGPKAKVAKYEDEIARHRQILKIGSINLL